MAPGVYESEDDVSGMFAIPYQKRFADGEIISASGMVIKNEYYYQEISIFSQTSWKGPIYTEAEFLMLSMSIPLNEITILGV